MEIETLKNVTKSALLLPNISDMLMQKLDQNISVQRMWNSIVMDALPEALSQELLCIFKKRWIKLRV
jgi:hypothetical protein